MTLSSPLLDSWLPVRNAAADLPDFLANAAAFCDAIVAPDDGSTDGTPRARSGPRSSETRTGIAVKRLPTFVPKRQDDLRRIGYEIGFLANGIVLQLRTMSSADTSS